MARAAAGRQRLRPISTRVSALVRVIGKPEMIHLDEKSPVVDVLRPDSSPDHALYRRLAFSGSSAGHPDDEMWIDPR
jgi:hypothetical protein